MTDEEQHVYRLEALSILRGGVDLPNLRDTDHDELIEVYQALLHVATLSVKVGLLADEPPRTLDAYFGELYYLLDHPDDDAV